MNRHLLLVLAFAVLASCGKGDSRPDLDIQPSEVVYDIAKNPLRKDAAGIAIGGIEPNPDGGPPLNIDNIIAYSDSAVIISRDARDTFTVPLPGDPEWPDYLEYRRNFRTGLDNEPGFVVPYDPEWRAQQIGYRQVPDSGYELSGGADSLQDLLAQVVDAVGVEDYQRLIDLAIRKEEFEILCWPTFPQSRPFVRIPWEEAWGFQYANLLGGTREGVRQADGGFYDLESVGHTDVREFPGYRIVDGVVLGVKNRHTGESKEFTFVDSVIERNGVYKVFLYKD